MGAFGVFLLPKTKEKPMPIATDKDFANAAKLLEIQERKLRELETHINLLSSRYERLKKGHIRFQVSFHERVHQLEKRLEEVERNK